MIVFKHKGDFGKTIKYLKKRKEINFGIIERYGAEGVRILSAATPVNEGETAASWRYEIKRYPTFAKLIFANSNIQNGVNIAVILQYGHGTRNGGWVEGRDYINSSIQPLFDRLVEDIWREVKNG